MAAAKTRKTTATNSGDDVVDEINALLGGATVMRLGTSKLPTVDSVTSGVMTVDLASGIGGLPFGRMVEIYGPPSGGKTTLALHVIAEAQKAGLECAFLDLEYALDVTYARGIGVDVENLIVSQPETTEMAFETLKKVCDSGKVRVIVVDSVAAMSPRAELEGEMGDANVGLQPRLMSKGLRTLVGTVSKNDVLLIWINQIREKVGVMYGSPEQTTGGRGLPFYASMRLRVSRVKTVKVGEEAVANQVKVAFDKNKVGAPYRVALFDIRFDGTGIDKTGALIDCAVEAGILKKSGNWYTYEGEQLGNGKGQAGEFLDDSPTMYDEIYKRVRESYGDRLGTAIGDGEVESDDE